MEGEKSLFQQRQTLPAMAGDGASGDGQKLQMGRFRLDMRPNCFPGRKVWELCSAVLIKCNVNLVQTSTTGK